jgi:monomeric isocitrate dehydrogenase
MEQAHPVSLILAVFAGKLPADQKTADSMAELDALTPLSEAHTIKLPNISASIPELKAAIKKFPLSF